MSQKEKQKAILKATKGVVMTPAEWEFATDEYKELRKGRRMNATQFKEYLNHVAEIDLDLEQIENLISYLEQMKKNKQD